MVTAFTWPGEYCCLELVTALDDGVKVVCEKEWLGNNQETQRENEAVCSTTVHRDLLPWIQMNDGKRVWGWPMPVRPVGGKA